MATDNQPGAGHGFPVNWKQKGAEGYLKYHNAVYHTGHNEGELTTADIESAARAAGVAELKPVDYTAVLEKMMRWHRRWGCPEPPV